MDQIQSSALSNDKDFGHKNIEANNDMPATVQDYDIPEDKLPQFPFSLKHGEASEVRYGIYTKEEWKPIAKHFRPDWSDAEYDREWESFQAFKKEREEWAKQRAEAK